MKELAPNTTPARRGWLRRAVLAREGFWFSLAIALGVHAGLVVLGLMVYAVVKFEPPRLVLPYGWATDLEGSGRAGVAPPGNESAMPIIQPAGAAGVDREQALSAASREWAATDVPAPIEPPKTTLDEKLGTQEVSEFPRALASPDGPPASITKFPAIFVSEESPAGGASGEGGRTGSATSASGRASGAPVGDGTGPTGRGTPTGEAGGQGRADSGDGKGNGGGPLGALDGVIMPDVHNRAPVYPEIALRRGWSGTVVLEMELNESGRVQSVRVAETSGHDVLDNSAVKAAKTWQFSPARINGVAVAITVKRAINFIRPGA